MGASGWEYYVPYREDLGAALAELHQKAFEEHDYLWYDWEPEGERPPRPQRIDDLWNAVEESGTHSILDIYRVIDPGGPVTYSTHNVVRPVTPQEAMECLGVQRLTREHVPQFDVFPRWRWFGRCAVLHDDHGKPDEIYFWGHSGD